MWTGRVAQKNFFVPRVVRGRVIGPFRTIRIIFRQPGVEEPGRLRPTQGFVVACLVSAILWGIVIAAWVWL